MEALTHPVTPLLAGYALDLLLGDPRWLPHPIVGYGRVIAWGERRLNREPQRFLKGTLLAMGLIVGVFALVTVTMDAAFQLNSVVGCALATAGVFFGLANRTLITEGRAVFCALEENLSAGRTRLAWIVGRDTARLEAAEVRTAVFETMAENLSDGVVAPLFYYAAGGVPAMLTYKMVNTLDSMIGHKDGRYFWFGKAAARIDDAANFIPARLTALLLVLVAGSRRGWRFVVRYGRAHESPNAGYPEAAVAGIFDLRFGGPHTYDGEVVPKPWIGTNPRVIAAGEIDRLARLNHTVCFASVALVALCVTFPWAN